ncbi:MAG: hypothetical protein ABI634_14100 [Acidobacteriota bacterium]
MRRTGSSAQSFEQSIWIPPVDWRESRPGIYEPLGYAASPWEVAPPIVATPKDEVREYLRCAASLPYFALHYCWTLHVDDPDGARPRRLPAFPYIREMLADLQTPTNTLTEKSRQMLTSWIFCSAFVYDLLFVHNAPLLMVSKRARDVDDGGANSTVDCLLGKVRFIHERLPRFLWHPFSFKKWEVRSLHTGSYIKGETGTGGQVARGPSYGRGLADEFAYAKHSESMFAGLRQACKRGLELNSTPDGRGNTFARLAHSKTTTFRKRTLHWTRHPLMAIDLACLCGWKAKAGPGASLPDVQFQEHRKSCKRERGAKPTSTYYRNTAADLTPEKLASELDISYDRTAAAAVFDGYDATRHLFDVADVRDRRTGKLMGPPGVAEDDLTYKRRVLPGLIDPRFPLVIFWDFGVADETYVALGQVLDDEAQTTRWLDELVDSGKAWSHYHQLIVTVWMTSYLEACGHTPDSMQAYADRRHLDWSNRVAFVPDLVNEVPRGCLPVYHAGDPAGRQRDSSLSSWTRNLQMADPSMSLRTVPFAKPADGSLLDWIDHVRQLVRRNGVSLSSFCTRLADALADWKWPTDKDGNVIPGSTKPVHDKHSHAGTALVMGYRTRWRGQLVALDAPGRGRAAQEEMVVSEGRSGREWRPEAQLRRKDLHDRTAALVGGVEDEDEFDDDE